MNSPSAFCEIQELIFFSLATELLVAFHVDACSELLKQTSVDLAELRPTNFGNRSNLRCHPSFYALRIRRFSCIPID